MGLGEGKGRERCCDYIIIRKDKDKNIFKEINFWPPSNATMSFKRKNSPHLLKTICNVILCHYKLKKECDIHNIYDVPLVIAKAELVLRGTNINPDIMKGLYFLIHVSLYTTVMG